MTGGGSGDCSGCDGIVAFVVAIEAAAGGGARVRGRFRGGDALPFSDPDMMLWNALCACESALILVAQNADLGVWRSTKSLRSCKSYNDA